MTTDLMQAGFCFVSFFFFERGQGKRAKGHLGVEIGERERDKDTDRRGDRENG